MTRYLNYYSLLLLFCLGLANSAHGQNAIFNEHFAGCELPEGWETTVLFGGADWGVNDINRPDPEYGDECLLLFLDTPRAGKGDSSDITVHTPWITPINLPELTFTLDLLFYKPIGGPNELTIYYDQGQGPVVFENYTEPVNSGAQTDPLEISIPIANVDNSPIRISVRYQNHGRQDGAVTIDRYKLKGPQNEDCSQAIVLTPDAPVCLDGNNLEMGSNAVTDACTGIQTDKAMWYRFNATERKLMKVSSNANFNDVIDVYYGRCGDLVPIACSNRDEHGFTGEDVYFNTIEGLSYFIRVSAWDEPFSINYGRLCMSLNSASEIPQPEANDICSLAKEILLNQECVKGYNYHANLDGPLPVLNEKSRADVWFKYVNTSDQLLRFTTDADFADVITLYSGDCNNLTRVGGNERGLDMGQFELKPGEYYFQVSGYFATIEGSLCAKIEEVDDTDVSNDLCPEAMALVTNAECLEISNLNAISSGVKSSCQIYPGADLWFTFVAPDNGETHFLIESEFIYDYAIYSGNCDSLYEVDCGYNPHSCEGPFNVSNLNSGETYYLQISSHVNEFGQLKGDLCVGVFDNDNAPDFDAIALDAQVECIVPGLGVLHVAATGGRGNLTFFGNQEGDIFLNGENYDIIVEDEVGCRQLQSGVIFCDGDLCLDTDLVIDYEINCELDQFGLNTGKATIVYTVGGMPGNIRTYGTVSGSTLLHGQSFEIYALDENDCMTFVRGQVDCLPFDCSQSDLSLNVDYECIDSLLRAKLIVTASEGNGQYAFSGNLDGDLLETGDSFSTLVTDEKGCMVEVQGTINCDFDSCAYSDLTGVVEIECLKDNQGGNTGRAVVHITHIGGQGNISTSGTQDGDTLFNGDAYEIILTDDWGCEYIETGSVDCAPVRTNNIVNDRIRDIYPIPTTNWIRIDYDAKSSDNVEVSIFTSNGKKLFTQSKDVNTGLNELMLYFDQYPGGVYHVELKQNNALSIGRIVIQ